MKRIARLFKPKGNLTSPATTNDAADPPDTTQRDTNTIVEEKPPLIPDKIWFSSVVPFEEYVPLDILKTVLSNCIRDEVVLFWNVNKRWNSVIENLYDWRTECLAFLMPNAKFVHKPNTKWPAMYKHFLLLQDSTTQISTYEKSNKVTLPPLLNINLVPLYYSADVSYEPGPLYIRLGAGHLLANSIKEYMEKPEEGTPPIFKLRGNKDEVRILTSCCKFVTEKYVQHYFTNLFNNLSNEHTSFEMDPNKEHMATEEINKRANMLTKYCDQLLAILYSSKQYVPQFVRWILFTTRLYLENQGCTIKEIIGVLASIWILRGICPVILAAPDNFYLVLGVSFRNFGFPRNEKIPPVVFIVAESV